MCERVATTAESILQHSEMLDSKFSIIVIISLNRIEIGNSFVFVASICSNASRQSDTVCTPAICHSMDSFDVRANGQYKFRRQPYPERRFCRAFQPGPIHK